MILLLLLTGLETDVKLLRNLGRSAFAASLFGMAVPFLFGFLLGVWMPKTYVANPDHRLLFALFLATAMSISAMPVIAKILIDLKLTQRNIGVVILSAGVVDDTTGWVLLSVIAGAAQGGASMSHLAISVGGTGLFVLAAAFVFYPVMKWALRVANDRFLSRETDLVFMLVFTLLCAAATDVLGVHAAFGAFIAGVVLRQVPHLRHETLHKLETVTLSLFAPIFFGAVGLKVDLWKLSGGGGGRMLGVVLLVACAGKLVGCSAGSMLGGLRFWESLSIAVAMNARGAMELVVATIGLSLGLLNQQMFSIIVMVAILTSFMAPLLLRFTVKLVRTTEDEAARMLAESAKGMFDPARLKVLVPTGGGPGEVIAAQLAASVVHHSVHPVTLLDLDRRSPTLRHRLGRLLRKAETVDEGDTLARLEKLRAHATDPGGRAPELRHHSSEDVAHALGQEAALGYDLVILGAPSSRGRIRSPAVEKLVSSAHCHVAIVRSRTVADGKPRRILVPVDGTFVSRAGVEFAVRYAEGCGEDAEITLAYLDGPPAVKDGALEKLSPVFKSTPVRANVIVMPSDVDPLLAETASGRHDLVVMGAENRAIHSRLFFGHENERLLDESTIPVVLVVPSTARGMHN
jgi:Kef-type K+ transport system membrane component KefB/nucleotide-binding universal stress UspA family protein